MENFSNHPRGKFRFTPRQAISPANTIVGAGQGQPFRPSTHLNFQQQMQLTGQGQPVRPYGPHHFNIRQQQMRPPVTMNFLQQQQQIQMMGFSDGGGGHSFGEQGTLRGRNHGQGPQRPQTLPARRFTNFNPSGPVDMTYKVVIPPPKEIKPEEGCLCYRRVECIYCKKCGFSSDNPIHRIKKTCPLHPKTIFPSDFTRCPQEKCPIDQLVEEPLST